MTVISKIKTLIDYAKFGMFICKYENAETGILFFPRAIKQYSQQNNTGWQTKATKITGHLETYGAISCLQLNNTCEIIDLPECINIAIGAWTGASDKALNETLKTVKVPKVRRLAINQFKNCKALKYIEVGALTSMSSTAVIGCDSLVEFYVKEGTMCNLYLQYCPKLTKECLSSIIMNFADMQGATPCTIFFGAENLAKLDVDDIGLMNTKNIEYQ